MMIGINRLFIRPYYTCTSRSCLLKKKRKENVLSAVLRKTALLSSMKGGTLVNLSEACRKYVHRLKVYLFLPTILECNRLVATLKHSPKIFGPTAKEVRRTSDNQILSVITRDVIFVCLCNYLGLNDVGLKETEDPSHHLRKTELLHNVAREFSSLDHVPPDTSATKSMAVIYKGYNDECKRRYPGLDISALSSSSLSSLGKMMSFYPLLYTEFMETGPCKTSVRVLKSLERHLVSGLVFRGKHYLDSESPIKPGLGYYQRPGVIKTFDINACYGSILSNGSAPSGKRHPSFYRR